MAFNETFIKISSCACCRESDVKPTLNIDFGRMKGLVVLLHQAMADYHQSIIRFKMFSSPICDGMITKITTLTVFTAITLIKKRK